MSFFDDDDPPTQARPGPRPRARPRQPAGAHSVAPPTPEARRNRLIALGAGGLVFLVLFALLISSCRNSAKERALKEYNREVTVLAQKSRDNSQQLFDALNSRGGDTETAVSQIRLEAEDTANRAEGLDTPGDMKPAQRSLLMVLNFRASAIGKIAEQIRPAQGNSASAAEAVQKIAGQMRVFLASDVLYSQRVAPLIDEAFKKNGIGTGQTIVSSQFLPSDGWLNTRQVADRINPNALSGSRGGTIAPGTHGHGLIGTKIAGQTLQPKTTGQTNRITVAAGVKPTVDVTIQNQGENDESDVVVTVKVTQQGKVTTLRKTIPLSKKGEESVASVAFKDEPGKGAAEIDVSIGKVGGEQKTENNKATYSVLFQ